jgi:hypothetical protein
LLHESAGDVVEHGDQVEFLLVTPPMAARACWPAIANTSA